MKSIENQLRAKANGIVTDTELDILLSGTPDSRYGKVKRLIAQGKLLHIRRGLYCLTSESSYYDKLHPFELAQFIYTPSYISLESALAYHQLIPETVYVTTSVCTKRSKDFNTPLGKFSYLHLPAENFFIGVDLIEENKRRFFMAKPWKAICDYVFCYKKNWNSINPLIESLRIDKENLPLLRYEDVELLNEYYHHRRMMSFLKSVKRDLKL